MTIQSLDEMYEKIDKLKTVRVDADNYCTYYIDNVTNEKWVKEHPEAEYHGGGVPQLRLLEKFPWD